MALIPGTLPNDTCYGTPQDLLELFAQYLDVPAFALSSKVVFSTTNTGFTSDIVWFDTTSATRPIMKITVSSSGFLDYVKNYITAAPVVTIVGADSVLILDASDSSNTKRGLVSDIVSLVPITPAAGSITYPMLSTSATVSDTVVRRVARAAVYCTLAGTTITVDTAASFNVTSITYTTTSRYTVNFAASVFPDGKYVMAGSIRADTGGSPPGPWVNFFGTYSSTTPTATACEIGIANINIRDGWTGPNPITTMGIVAFR